MSAPKQLLDHSNQAEYHTLRLVDLAILIANVYRGAQLSKVGFEDAERTIDDIIQDLEGRRGMRIKRDVIESALWSCNLQDEIGKFWHPKNRSFEEFKKDILTRRQSFDPTYNFIKEKK